MMREEWLIVKPFEDIRILDYKSTQAVNEHARAEVRGRIPFKKRVDYINLGKQQTWAQVVAMSEGEESVMFYGVIEQLQIEINHGTCNVVLSLCSGTRLMDYKEHIRSFQKEDFTYSSLLDTCGKEYEETGRIMTEGNGKRIPHFIMQYKETDWEFIKRLAAMNHTVIFADCSTRGEKYHFGVPDRKFDLEGTLNEYRMRYDIQE